MIFFCKTMGVSISPFWLIWDSNNARYFALLTRNRRFSPSYNLFQIGRKKLIRHNSFATRSYIYHFVFYMPRKGMIFTKNFKFCIFFFILFLLHLIFSCYYCSIDLKGQSEQSVFALIRAVLLYLSGKSLFENRGAFLRTTDSCFCFAKCGNTFHFPVFSWLVYLFGFVFVPTFDTKVTEYLCSGWVFFFPRQISTF